MCVCKASNKELIHLMPMQCLRRDNPILNSQSFLSLSAWVSSRQRLIGLFFQACNVRLRVKIWWKGHFGSMLPSTWGIFTSKFTLLDIPQLVGWLSSCPPLMNLQALVAMRFRREFPPSYPIETKFFTCTTLFLSFFFLFFFHYSFHLERLCQLLWWETWNHYGGGTLYSHESRSCRIEGNLGFKDG